MFPVKSVMTTDVTTVAPDTLITEALGFLTKKRISGLPVIDVQGHVVGVLSEKDVLRILLDKNLDSRKQVRDYMTREVICFSEEDSAVEVCKFFIRSNIRRVPIVREGKLVGIVSRRDIVELIMEAESKISALRYD